MSAVATPIYENGDYWISIGGKTRSGAQEYFVWRNTNTHAVRVASISTGYERAKLEADTRAKGVRLI